MLRPVRTLLLLLLLALQEPAMCRKVVKNKPARHRAAAARGLRDVSWIQLSEEEQIAAQTVGYTEPVWNLYKNFGKLRSVVNNMETAWVDMTPEVQSAYRVLGWTKTRWEEVKQSIFNRFPGLEIGEKRASFKRLSSQFQVSHMANVPCVCTVKYAYVRL